MTDPKRKAAEALIAEFASDLARLARGSIPDQWQRLTARALRRPPVNALVSAAQSGLAYLEPKKTRPHLKANKPTGRPRRNPIGYQAALVEIVKNEIDKLGLAAGRRGADSRAIKSYCLREYADASQAWLEKEIAWMRKALPTARKAVASRMSPKSGERKSR